MSVGTFLLTTHGIDLIERTSGQVYAWRGTDLVGAVWPDYRGWNALLRGSEQRQVLSRHAGLANLVGGCPDCVCDQRECESDDAGRHCETVNCGYCLHGCSEDCPPSTSTTA